MHKSIVGGLLQKWKNKYVLCQKFPAIEGRPESSKWSLQQLAVGGMTEYARFEHQKNSFGSTRHNRIHSCSFKSRMPTNTACLHQKRTLRLFDADPICYRNCCGIEQSITTSTPLSKSQFSYGKTPEDGTWVLRILYSEHMKFFLQQIAVKVKKYAMFRQWQKLNGMNWWLTCIPWYFGSWRGA